MLQGTKGGNTIKRNLIRLSASISSIHRGIQKIKGDALEEFGMGNIHAMCIYSIGTAPGISATGICDVTSADKAAVSKAIKELTDFGYATRPTGEKRAYRAGIYLTEKGKELFAIVDRKLGQASESVFKEISTIEYDTTMKTLSVIIKNLKL